MCESGLSRGSRGLGEGSPLSGSTTLPTGYRFGTIKHNSTSAATYRWTDEHNHTPSQC